MKLIKNALYITVLSTLIVGCGVKKESPDSASDETPTPEFTKKVNDDVSALNASISQGVNELKNLNDPNIGEIYNAINSLHADSTINDLNAINTMVFNHLEAIKSGQFNPPNSPVGMAQDDMSLAAQLADAQQNSSYGVDGLIMNLDRLKKVDKVQYEAINKHIKDLDLYSLNGEDLQQLNNIVSKAIVDAKVTR